MILSTLYNDVFKKSLLKSMHAKWLVINILENVHCLYEIGKTLTTHNFSLQQYKYLHNFCKRIQCPQFFFDKGHYKLN